MTALSFRNATPRLNGPCREDKKVKYFRRIQRVRIMTRACISTRGAACQSAVNTFVVDRRWEGWAGAGQGLGQIIKPE